MRQFFFKILLYIYQGAEFVYKELKSFIESSYLSSAAALTKREESLALHEAYLVARTTVFVGGETNAKYLSLAMQKGRFYPHEDAFVRSTKGRGVFGFHKRNIKPKKKN